MTLIASLISPDGIVLAGDSLSTNLAALNTQVQFPAECPTCHAKFSVGGNVQLAPLPRSTFSFAQKIFPFLRRYALGTFGQAQLAGKTMHFALRELERKLADEQYQPANIADIISRINEQLLSLLDLQYPDRRTNAPDGWFALGYQFVGYEGPAPKAYEIRFVGKGDPVIIDKTVPSGCTVSGDTFIVSCLWDFHLKNPIHSPAFEVFSIQDAIDYAEVLISTTATYQRFTRNMPTVGGEIDIGLATPFDNFRWIKRKKLSHILTGDTL